MKLYRISIIIICIGVLTFAFFVSSLYFKMTGDGLGGGYGAMLISFPLILVGLIILVASFFKRKNR